MKRNFSIEEKYWLDLKKLFEDEFDNFEGISSETQTKEEMYEGLGRHYDAVFKEQAGMSIEEFVQKHKTYYTFSEMVKHRLTGEKTSRFLPKRTRMSIEDKLTHRLKTNLVSEKGLGFSILNTKKLLELDYRTLWIADCIAWAIATKNKIEFDDDTDRKEIAKAGISDLEK